MEDNPVFTTITNITKTVLSFNGSYNKLIAKGITTNSFLITIYQATFGLPTIQQ